MSFETFIKSRSNTSAEKLVETNVYDPTTGQTEKTQTWVTIGKCVFWHGVSSKLAITDSLRERVDATAGFIPSVDVNFERLRIDGKYEYSIEGVDNIANKNKIKIVYLSKIT